MYQSSMGGGSLSHAAPVAAGRGRGGGGAPSAVCDPEGATTTAGQPSQWAVAAAREPALSVLSSDGEDDMYGSTPVPPLPLLLPPAPIPLPPAAGAITPTARSASAAAATTAGGGGVRRSSQAGGGGGFLLSSATATSAVTRSNSSGAIKVVFAPAAAAKLESMVRLVSSRRVSTIATSAATQSVSGDRSAGGVGSVEDVPVVAGAGAVLMQPQQQLSSPVR
jgi:hypothetical protein